MADTTPIPATPAKPAVKVFHPFAATIPPGGIGLADEVLSEVSALPANGSDPARLAFVQGVVASLAKQFFPDARGLEVKMEFSAHKSFQLMVVVTPGLEHKS
jgi:hypothetical protein